MTVLSITSCDGIIGSSIASHLAKLDTKKFKEIRLLCEHKSKMHNHFDMPEPNKQNCACHEVSFTDKEAMKTALHGSHFLVVIPPVGDHKWQASETILEAAQLAKVKDAILISWTGTNESNESIKDTVSELHKVHEFDSKFMSSNVKIQHKLIVRANFLIQNLLTYASIILNDQVLPFPVGAGKVALLDAECMGEAIAKLCSNKSLDPKYVGQSLTFTGPKAISGVEIAHELSSVFKKEIKFQDISLDEAETILKSTSPKLAVSEIQTLLDTYKLIKRGIMDRCSSDIADIGVNNPAFADSVEVLKPRFLNLASINEAKSSKDK